MDRNSGSIGIIGAGPAGIAAALQAARGPYEVHLLDSNPQIGRKLLVTGSGRCNITNLHIDPQRYSCSEDNFVPTVLAAFSQNFLVERLAELGIFTYATPDGWVYPISNSAANVASLLFAHLKAAGVKLHLGTAVTSIRLADGRYTVTSSQSQQAMVLDRLVIASGGKAYPALGSNGSIFPMLSALGHTILPVQPALAPLETDTRPIHKLQGVRLDAGVKLFLGKKLLGHTTGNIIFTEWGINGPGVMDLSHLAARHSGAEMTVVLNFLDAQEAKLNQLLNEDRFKAIPFSTLLGSLLPSKLVRKVFLDLGLPLEGTLDSLGPKNMERLLSTLTRFSIRVKGSTRL